MRTVLSAIAAGLLLLTAVATATAATVHGNRSAEEVTYRAGPGEANALTFGAEPAGIIVRDPGATIVATGACVSRDPHTAVCPFVPIVNVALGDLNDSTGDAEDAEGPMYGNVRGGEGDDALRWSLVGVIDGGPGNDTLTGLGDENTFMIGGPGADVFRGASWALSVVSYEAERAGVRVTLDGVANDGAPGERDNVTRAIRFIVGSRGADVLIGNEGGQWLHGFEGNDRLVGRGARDVFFGDAGNDVSIGGAGNDAFRDFGGNDRLFGGPGRDAVSAHGGADLLVGGPGHDRLNGGPGPDRFFARDGMRDRVFGGDGRDRARVDGRDRVALVERVL